MKSSQFDFVRFREFRAAREERIRAFYQGDGCPVLLQERTGVNYTICRTPQESLECQLDGITACMDLDGDYLPFLEPWFGVGVFANAFGCEYVWTPGGSPQTHYIVFDEDAAARIERPDLSRAPVMNLVLDAIRYFLEETRGEIPISCTDTQSPFDTATLIWDSSSFLTSLYTAPEVAHRFLNLLTDVTIDFTRTQLSLLGEVAARPGHIMLSAPGAPGISISDDNVVMVSPETYAEFSVPYNERIADAFGGVAIHSCGNYERQLPALLQTRGLLLLDGAFSPMMDPCPNLQFEAVGAQMKSSRIILQPRLHQEWPAALKRLYTPGIRLAPVILPPEPGQPSNYNRALVNKMLSL